MGNMFTGQGNFKRQYEKRGDIKHISPQLKKSWVPIKHIPPQSENYNYSISYVLYMPLVKICDKNT